jgi:hypothetical protein
LIDPTQIHEVHGSVLKSFQGCRLQYKWNFIDGYTPPTVAAPLEFGSAFHRGMEVLYNPDTWDLPLLELYRLAKEEFTNVCMHQLEAFLNRAALYQLDHEAEVDYLKRIELGCGMLRKVARTMDRKSFKPVLTEKEIFVPIKYPTTDQQLHCRCNDCWDKSSKADPDLIPTEWSGLPVYYGLRVDAVLVDEDGGYWLVDWKTASQLLKDQLILELDGQIINYLWALKLASGLDLRGFKYVQILKDFPHKPRELVNVRLGRKFSVAKNARTDAATFSTYVKKHDSDAFKAGLYAEHIEYLRNFGPMFINWMTVYKTDQQLEVVGTDLAYAVKDLLDSPDIYATGGRMVCQRCVFQEPCLERQSGGDFQDILDSQYEKLPPYFIIERERRKADA